MAHQQHTHAPWGAGAARPMAHQQHTSSTKTHTSSTKTQKHTHTHDRARGSSMAAQPLNRHKHVGTHTIVLGVAAWPPNPSTDTNTQGSATSASCPPTHFYDLSVRIFSNAAGAAAVTAAPTLCPKPTVAGSTIACQQRPDNSALYYPLLMLLLLLSLLR